MYIMHEYIRHPVNVQVSKFVVSMFQSDSVRGSKSSEAKAR